MDSKIIKTAACTNTHRREPFAMETNSPTNLMAPGVVRALQVWAVIIGIITATIDWKCIMYTDTRRRIWDVPFHFIPLAVVWDGHHYYLNIINEKTERLSNCQRSQRPKAIKVGLNSGHFWLESLWGLSLPLSGLPQTSSQTTCCTAWVSISSSISLVSHSSRKHMERLMALPWLLGLSWRGSTSPGRKHISKIIISNARK